MPGRTKDVVVTENTPIVLLCGLKIPDPAFIFELQSILEGFITKNLNAYKETTFPNSIFDTDDNDVKFYVMRKGSLLVTTLEDYEGAIYSTIELDILKAKTVVSMLHKAVYAMELC